MRRSILIVFLLFAGLTDASAEDAVWIPRLDAVACQEVRSLAEGHAVLGIRRDPRRWINSRTENYWFDTVYLREINAPGRPRWITSGDILTTIYASAVPYECERLNVAFWLDLIESYDFQIQLNDPPVVRRRWWSINEAGDLCIDRLSPAEYFEDLRRWGRSSRIQDRPSPEDQERVSVYASGLAGNGMIGSVEPSTSFFWRNRAACEAVVTAVRNALQRYR